jgi:hypothetical protein
MNDMAASVAEERIVIEGLVEMLDERTGVAGWAIDRADPTRPITLALWVNDVRVATTETGIERPDVCEALGADGRPGFRFPPETGEMILAAARDGSSGALTVRVDDMPSTPSLPGASRTLDRVRLDLTRAEIATSEALNDLLAIHARTARRLLEEPLPPLPGQGSGFVEAIAPDEDGNVWVTGWIADDGVLDRPITILDDARHAAGGAFAVIPRDDLPQGYVGFVGVLQTNWRPGSTIPPSLVMADIADCLIEPLRPTPVRTNADMAPLVAHNLAIGEGPYRNLLRDMFYAEPRWTVGVEQPSADRLQIDEFIILPGFGAFVSGWALSPSKDLENFEVKAGGRVFSADPRSICRHERPDLAGVYPNLADMSEAAGFIVAFRGSFEDVRADELIVKVTWNDRSSTNDRVVPTMVRVIGRTAPIDAVYRFYPEIEREHFFADFARCAAVDARAQAREVRGYAAEPAAHVLILAVPTTSSDLFLLYDTILRHAAALPPDWGIALLGEADRLRPLLVSLFADIVRTTGRPCSLFFTRRGRPTSEAIDAILQAIGASRFAYVDAHVALLPCGWAAIGSASGGMSLLLAEGRPEFPEPTRALDAFVADRATWQRLLCAAPPRIGGIAATPEEGSAPIENAVLTLATSAITPLANGINEIIERHRD